jgi:predicted Zn-dependent protease
MLSRRLSVLLVMMLLVVRPCAADLLHIPADQEISLGREAAARFEQGVRLLGGPQAERVRRIGLRVAAVTGRPELPFTFKIVDRDAINAVTFPGGFVYVYRGLLEQHLDDDELAGVLGHEIAHAVKSHAVKEMYPMLLVKKWQARVPGAERARAVTNLLETLTQRGLGRHLELEADSLGTQYAYAAGYRADGLMRVLQGFAQMEVHNPNAISALAATHPPATLRLKKLRPVVAGLTSGRR